MVPIEAICALFDPSLAVSPSLHFSDGLSVMFLGDGLSAIDEASGVGGYLLVLLFAAIPWIEILVVIPIAIAAGLDPVSVGIVAVIGNAGSVGLLLVFQQRITRWRARRRADSGTESTAGETSSPSRRQAWAQRIWDRYGLPGLSFAAPGLTGVHLAALLALAVGSSPRAVGWWMTISIVVWSVALVAASVAGLSLVGLG